MQVVAIWLQLARATGWISTWGLNCTYATRISLASMRSDDRWIAIVRLAVRRTFTLVQSQFDATKMKDAKAPCPFWTR